MKYALYYLLLFYALICAFTIAFFDGTGDSGDSISHYLFAKYAPKHPALYFDHWAKPLFVLLASPFAQFGFIGVKVFNSLIALTIIFFTYKTAERIQLKNTILVVVFLIFSPLFYILTFSGLTEPLFALIGIIGFYFCTQQKYMSAALIISFLPYVRSEGLIVIGVFSLYFLYKKAWKVLPVLFFGSVVYGIAGFFVHGNFLWVFTKIPYAKLSSVYGHGQPFHFVEQLINVTGVPIYVIFWLGFIGLSIQLFKQKLHAENHILVLIGFLSFFAAHSLFWYLGIFNSMGLKRVLLGIMPLIAITALFGFNFITEQFTSNAKIKTGLRVFIVAYVLVFPFTLNPAAIQWEKDLMLSSDQKIANQLSQNILKKESLQYPLLYNHRYLSLPLNIDYFDPTRCKQITIENILQMKSGDILIWDNQYANFESGLEKKDLDSRNDLETIETLQSNELGKDVIFSVYKKM